MHISQAFITETKVVKQTPHQVTDVEEYYGSPGKQHYALLTWLASQFQNSELFDIGTHQGASAYCLASNSSNTVQSFDITHANLILRAANCTYNLKNLWDPDIRTQWEKRLLNSPLIFFDVDPHEGSMEYEFYCWLRDNGYRGLLVMDDIWYFSGLRDTWNRIDVTKYDLTSLGHWSGTGLVDFSQKVTLEGYVSTSDWTLVTAYFDLTCEPDASNEIRNRPFSHYLSNAKGTMGVSQNLVVFCDENTKPLLEQLRPKHLRETKTQFIVCKFSEFEIVKKYRQKIAHNRGNYPFDSRNTPSYYLLCMIRYVTLLHVMKSNPFNSTHFAWINICLERMGWRNIASLESALAIHRNLFSCCWIDYIPHYKVKTYSVYFNPPQCGMCSGFFTGGIVAMTAFCNEILNTFYECVEQGYGHADEQLYLIVYYRNPLIFDPYFGDYTEMVTNYVTVKERPTEPVRNIIQNAFFANDFPIALKACKALWNDGRHNLPENVLMKYLQYFLYSAIHCSDWNAVTMVTECLFPKIRHTFH